MTEHFHVFPIGTVKKHQDDVTIEIEEACEDALLGLDRFSHIIVFSWFHKNDTPEKRNTLRVHPRGDRARPLRGVFATRSPVRPNLIAMSTCKVLSVERNVIHIDGIDCFNGTPVIDIKPCVSRNDLDTDIEVD
jgi:tRNA-Thr(GGU) m(6)t(6)A37 methyltransferase TsaA